MPRIDYQTLSNTYKSHAWNRLSNPYLSHAWNRLLDTKQPIFISCLEKTIIHYATHTNIMPEIDY